jgi:hypothetical protein
MDLGPQPPPGANPNPNSNTQPPPKKPPEARTEPQPHKKTRKEATDNPFQAIDPRRINEIHKQSLSEGINAYRALFRYYPQERFTATGAPLGEGIPSDIFHSAAITVISAIERGYFSDTDPTPLTATEWAKLSCTLLAAIGRGYARPELLVKESILDKVRAEVVDPNPANPNHATLYHRLTATADQIEISTGVDQEGYKDWYIELKKTFQEKASKSALTEVEESWRLWKADQINKRAEAQEAEISEAVRNKNARYLFTAAAELGLTFNAPHPPEGLCSTPTTGKKRTVSGSMATAGPSTPAAIRTSLPRAAKRTPSPMATPRGRTVEPLHLPSARADPSPTPQPRKAPPIAQPMLAAGSKAKVNPTPMGPPPQPPKPPAQRDDDATMTILQAILSRLDALEKGDNAKPRPLPAPASRPIAQPPAARNSQQNVQGTEAHAPSPNTDDGFTLVERGKKRGKAAGKTANGASPTEHPGQIIITPASYARAAAAATNLQQQRPAHKGATRPMGVTEVTVLRTGGHADPQVERYIRSRAADAIVREVSLKMAKAVAHPIPLRAGRWSVHPRSKGNFVFTFDGCIPFDSIEPYEHILLAPFQGSGQLRPSLGWTRLLIHGVPLTNNNDTVFGPEALKTEVRTLPGLRKAHFAMEPRWLKPIEQINGPYSTVTFAVSDPDGTITNTLLTSWAALFGKEVAIRKWIDKPALVQCSRCHALGHSKTSKACTLGRDSAKCYICGGAHASEEHDQRCSRKHTVAGVCDCKHFKCLNCQQRGHHCREKVCPSRELFRPPAPRKPRARNKGKGRATTLGDVIPSDHSENHTPTEDHANLYAQAPGPSSLGFWGDSDPRSGWDDAPAPESTPAPADGMLVDSSPTPQAPQTATQPNPQNNAYSPSHPQTGAANQSLN